VMVSSIRFAMKHTVCDEAHGVHYAKHTLVMERTVCDGVKYTLCDGAHSV
jgi:hypothetical protein